MKFLCDNCKAKYQIPDEKIAGRTLRMKCRKCGHSIIIRGPKSGGAAPAPAARPSAAGRRRSGSGLSSVGPTPRRRGGSGASPRPAPRSSALGA
ncbi:MAG TPA: zinc-ribbon domain-containing protein, partial [Polyangiaceae bacterium LLY-WYZ-15_(1-7)]|nr:zinc-ribbon domain-containing protein [Polyangiaceae bacterium LLY-WYZ-15_(1-7)]